MKKRRRRLIFAVILVIIAAGSMVTALSLLSKVQFLQINDVVVSSTPATPLVSPADEIQTIVQNDLSGSWWHLFSKNNIFLYPKNTIREDIMRAFPRIQALAIGRESLGSLDTIIVSVTERTPFALACAAPAPVGGPAKCFYMDADGFIYAPAPQFSPGVYIQYYSTVTATGTPIAVGGTFADPTSFSVALQAVHFISEMGIQVSSVSIADGGEYTIAVKDIYATSTGKMASVQSATTTASVQMNPLVSLIYFNLTIPLEKTLDYFQQFWQSRDDKNFDYIDLRYGTDIVFKMQ
jgi:hypothetical protein